MFDYIEILLLIFIQLIFILKYLYYYCKYLFGLCYSSEAERSIYLRYPKLVIGEI